MDIMERIYNLKREHYREYGMHHAYAPNTVILGHDEYIELKRHIDSHKVVSLREMRMPPGSRYNLLMGMELIRATEDSCLRLGHMMEGGGTDER